MSAPLAYRRIDPEVLVSICGFLLCRCRDRPIEAVLSLDPKRTGAGLTHHGEGRQSAAILPVTRHMLRLGH
jgi:hypothetical protein